MSEANEFFRDEDEITFEQLDASLGEFIRAIIEQEINKQNLIRGASMYVISATSATVTGYDILDESEFNFTVPNAMGITPTNGQIVTLVMRDDNTLSNSVALYKASV